MSTLMSEPVSHGWLGHLAASVEQCAFQHAMSSGFFGWDGSLVIQAYFLKAWILMKAIVCPSAPGAYPLAVSAMDRPPQHELAKALEAQPIIRQRLLSEETPYLTRWASQTAIGVRSVAAMRLNAVALEKLAEWWCPCNPSPKAVSISLLRQEAGNLDGGVIMELEPNHVQTNHRLCLFHFKIHSCQNQAP